MLPGRLIGLQAKFATFGWGSSCSLDLDTVTHLGFITDSTSCEEGAFTSPNPFRDMTVDVITGNSDSQTQTIELSTVWTSQCSYQYSVSPPVTWLTHSVPAVGQVRFDVTSNDMNLAGTNVPITVTLTPDYRDDAGFPAIVTYSFNVIFTCPTTSIDFTGFTSSQNYKVGQSALTTNAYTVTQTPQTCFTPTFSMTSTPATGIVTH